MASSMPLGAMIPACSSSPTSAIGEAGSPSPARGAGVGRPTSSRGGVATRRVESESHAMMRLGRTAVPSMAVPNSGRLPNIHHGLHRTVGVFNEYC